MYKETNAHEYHSTNQESTNQHNTKYRLDAVLVYLK